MTYHADAATAQEEKKETDAPPLTAQQADQLAAYAGSALELKCVNAVRGLAADMVQRARSGHPGAPMGCAPIAHVLWSEGGLRHSASDPGWWCRDRFVLSNGHACTLQYAMLHLSGYADCGLDELKRFRKLGSRTPGHPENFCTAGVEVCTGPLGQGISNAVGMAIAAKHLGATYNTPDFPDLMDSQTYVLCGDGCLQEGISGEASSLAGHLGLGNLIVLYDDNRITIDGSTDLAFTEDVALRYEAYGWQVLVVDDVAAGLDDLRSALATARRTADRPTLIKVRTDIGFGSPAKQGSAASHGAPLGEADLAAMKARLYGLDAQKAFFVDEDVAGHYRGAAAAGEAARAAWEARFARYAAAHPARAAELRRRFARDLAADVFDALPGAVPGEAGATRKLSGACLNAVAPRAPELMGGSADLAGSNCAELQGATDFQRDSPEGRTLRFGVREHAMAAICNGMFAYGGIRPFCATFLQFAGYALGAMRCSALSGFGVIYIMTHDSVGLGEDGPTHQPVEMLESLRATPNLDVFRAADANEMAAAYETALRGVRTPTVICCSRGAVGALEGSSRAGARRGAYAVVPEGGEGEAPPDLVVVATGSEVWRAVAAARALRDEHALRVRVVSMPCQEAFLRQDAEYRRAVLPGDVPTLSVEASSEHGWHRFSHAQIGMTTFGASAPADELFEKFGFSIENIANKGRQLVEFYKTVGVPDLNARPTFCNLQGSMGHSTTGSRDKKIDRTDHGDTSKPCNKSEVVVTP